MGDGTSCPKLEFPIITAKYIFTNNYLKVVGIHERQNSGDAKVRDKHNPQGHNDGKGYSPLRSFNFFPCCGHSIKSYESIETSGSSLDDPLNAKGQKTPLATFWDWNLRLGDVPVLQVH